MILETLDIERLCLFLYHKIWSYHMRALPWILRLFWIPQNIEESKIYFNPKKSFDNPHLLKSGVAPLGITLMRGTRSA